MKRALFFFAFAAAALMAKTSETRAFRARLLPSNEIPAVESAARGMCTVLLHIVRGDDGQIESGSADFVLSAQFPAATNLVGGHIHRGRSTENGPVVINSGITSVPVTTQPVAATFSGQVAADNAAGRDAIRDILRDHTGFYVNFHTTENPGGLIRGQLEEAELFALGGVMNGRKEVPALDHGGVGAGAVAVVVSRNAQGVITSGQVLMVVGYSLGETSVITGMHIHEGEAGINGPVRINSGLPNAFPSAPGGTGAIVSIAGPGGFVEVDMTNADQVRTLSLLVNNPSATYLNLHTTVFPGGAIRTQLRRMERISAPFEASAANEVPAVPQNSSATGSFDLFALRNEDGGLEMAAWVFDVNYRMPATATFTGMHIHRAKAGENGPVVMPAIFGGVPSATGGNGNLFLFTPPVLGGPQLEAADDFVRNPENYYFNLHTSDFPGGVMRGQMFGTPSNPTVIATVPANFDRASTRIAPGGLFTIFGRNLSKLTGSLAGWSGQTIPDALNNTAVAVGGRRARLLFVSPTQINGQAAFDTPLGTQGVVVNNGFGVSAAGEVAIAANAPAIFAGAVVKAADFSVVTRDNAAAAGDALIVFSTGFGQTTPGLDSGRLVPSMGRFNTVDATVTVAGANTEVLGSVAAPGFVGLYQTAFRVPTGVDPGARPVLIRVGDQTSNSVTIAVR